MKHNVVEKVEIYEVGGAECIRVEYWWHDKKQVSYFTVIATTPPLNVNAAQHLVSLLDK